MQLYIVIIFVIRCFETRIRQNNVYDNQIKNIIRGVNHHAYVKLKDYFNGETIFQAVN